MRWKGEYLRKCSPTFLPHLFSSHPTFHFHLSSFTLRSLIFCTLFLSRLGLLGFIGKCVSLSKSVTWTRRLPASRDERRKRFQGWIPRCIWVGVIMVWEEMDTCNLQVCLLLNKILSFFCAVSWFPFYCFAAPVDCTASPEYVALFSLSCISVCVREHTHTHVPTHSSPTRLEATFLLMHTIMTSTETKHLLICHDLNWEHAGQWEFDTRSLFW